MAAIGDLYLAGETCDLANRARSAFACALSAPLAADFKWPFEDDGWTVAGLRGVRFIVARSAQKLDAQQAQEQGFGAIQRALDLASAHRNETANLAAPGDNFLTLHETESDVVLTVNAVFHLGVQIRVSVEARDKDGNLKPQPKSSLPKWHRSLRYYRLSQLASDSYEAYRNLYLAFEALAEECYPRRNDEREGAWVRRCFGEFHREHDLSAFAPDGHPHPHEYLFGTLYEFVRCNLFHSRTANAILPFYEVNASVIGTAHESLLRIWRHLSSVVLGLSAGGGVVTHQGYRHWMDGVFSAGVSVVISDDEAAIARSDVQINPSGGNAYAMESCQYVGEVVPGVVGVRATERRIASVPRINRLGLVVGKVLHAVSDQQPGITLGGVTTLAVNLDQRLIQGSQPKVNFER